MPLLVLLTALGLQTAMILWKLAAASPAAFVFPRPAPSTWYYFPTEPVTYEQLRRLAKAPGLDDGFAARLLSRLAEWRQSSIDRYSIGWAALVPPEGNRSESTRYGWPWPIVWTSAEWSCADVFHEHGSAIPRRSGYPRWSTYHTEAFLYRPDTDGYCAIDAGPIAVGVTMILTVSAVIAPLLGWAAARRGRDPAQTRRAWRRRLRLAGCLLLAGIAAVGALRPRHEAGLYPRSSSGIRPNNSVSLGLDVARLRELAKSPKGTVTLARDLLQALAPSHAEGGVLALGIRQLADSNSQWTDIGWPLTCLEVIRENRVLFAPDGSKSPLDIPPHRTRVYSDDLSIGVVGGASAARPTATALRLDTGVVAVNALALWLLWHLSRGICRAKRRWTSSRRSGRGHCVVCGYDLRQPTA